MSIKALDTIAKVIFVVAIICALFFFITGQEHRLVMSAGFLCFAISLVLKMIYDQKVRKQAKDSEDEDEPE